MHARFLDHAGSPKCLRWRSLDILPSTQGQTVSAPGISLQSRLNGWPVPFPCRQAEILTDACARLGADVVRYSFIAVI